MKELSRSESENLTSPEMSQLFTKANKGDAALEFIKHVCAVLALDQNVQHDVLVFYFISFGSLAEIYNGPAWAREVGTATHTRQSWFCPCPRTHLRSIIVVGCLCKYFNFTKAYDR